MENGRFAFICNESDEEQLIRAKKQYDKLKKEVENDKNCVWYFSAFVPSYFSASEVYKYVELPTFLMPDEIGRALSHIHVYKKLLESNLEYVYVFEANCIISEKHFTSAFFRGVDTFFMEDDKAKIILLQEGYKGKYTGTLLGDCNLVHARGGSGLHGYIINRRAAEKILKLQHLLKFELDMYKYYYWLNLLEIYALDKNIVHSLGSKAIYGEYDKLNSVRIYDVEMKLRYRKYKLEYRKMNRNNKIRACILRLIDFLWI